MLVFNRSPDKLQTRPENKKFPNNKNWIRSIVFNETNGPNISWQPQPANRVVNQDSKKFIHISFANLTFDPEDVNNQDYIVDVLKGGVEVGGELYVYIGNSNSQLKSRSCFLYNATDLKTASRVIHNLGNFSSIRTVGKLSKRIGLLFTSSENNFELNMENTCDIEDIQRNGKVFSDGCGLITEEYAAELGKNILKKKGITKKRIIPNNNYIPQVFQIRYKGYKGILMVAKDKEFNSCSETTGRFQKLKAWLPFTPGRTENQKHIKVKFRLSMRKFIDCPLEDFCVLSYSKPGVSAKINAELVTLLSALGVPDDVFLKKQNQYFQFIQAASTSPRIAQDFLEYKGRHDLIKYVQDVPDNEMNTAPDFVQITIRELQKSELHNSFDKHDLERVHIRIPKSRLLLGVCDISGKLREGECFVKYTTNSMTLATNTLNGPIIVGRNPCLYPGDIQPFLAVENIPELNHLVDCIVFSTKGRLPPASLMSGGDLDGDKFFVCWDSDLCPQKFMDPLDYSMLQPEVEEKKSISEEDLIRYFAHYSTNLGEVMTLYWAWARGNPKERATSKECVELSKLYARCVDGEIVDIPGHLKKTPKPDRENPFILDKLKAQLRNALEGKFDPFLYSAPDTIVPELDQIVTKPETTVGKKIKNVSVACFRFIFGLICFVVCKIIWLFCILWKGLKAVIYLLKCAQEQISRDVQRVKCIYSALVKFYIGITWVVFIITYPLVLLKNCFIPPRLSQSARCRWSDRKSGQRQNPRFSTPGYSRVLRNA